MRLHRLALGAAGVLLGSLAWGCGGGATGGGTGGYGAVAGVVSDVDGAGVAGAKVSGGGSTATSLTNGSFTLPSVRSGYQTVAASLTIKGQKWSGQSVVDVVSNDANRSVNLVVSDERYQGAIAGSVIDQYGVGLEGAKVFVAGPVGSTLAISDFRGDYRVDRVTPGVTYSVTCSLAGYINDTKTVHVSDSQTAALSFALSTGGSAGAIPAPTGVSAQSWTISSVLQRSPSQGSALAWLREAYRRKAHLPASPVARTVQRTASSRVTPNGTLIEVDLYWSLPTYTDLFGFAIKRGTSPTGLGTTAVLRDPLARAFFDADDTLNVGQRTYYTVHSLDTIDFPNKGTIGPASAMVDALPLEPCFIDLPTQGASVGKTPILQWTPVAGAVTYQVFVWDRFPDLQSQTDPDGARAIWPADLGNPGASLVNAPRVGVTYSGPALRSGATYYWVAVASDSTGKSLSVTELGKFVVQ